MKGNCAPVWPAWLDARGLISGFTNRELEVLADRSKLPANRLPFFGREYLYFGGEIYGNGRAFRSVLGWPKLLPIPVSADHSVNLSHELEKGEVHSSSLVHLVYPIWRKSYTKLGKKRLFRTMHPWVLYRRQQNFTPNPSARGTLVFIDHGTTAKKERAVDWEAYFESFDNVDPSLRPAALLLHPNDIGNGIHLALRQFGLPIFTLGNRFDPMFVDRFYHLVGNFKYTTSTLIGSHVFLSEEFGVPFFIHGARRIDTMVESPNRIETWGTRFEEAMVLWSTHPSEQVREKMRFVAQSLGLQHKRQLNLVSLRLVFVVALFLEIFRKVSDGIRRYRAHSKRLIQNRRMNAA